MSTASVAQNKNKNNKKVKDWKIAERDREHARDPNFDPQPQLHSP